MALLTEEPLEVELQLAEFSVLRFADGSGLPQECGVQLTDTCGWLECDSTC